MITKACIIGWPRSGTTFLADSLCSHPQVYFYQELFNTGWDFKLEEIGLSDIRRTKPCAAIQHFYQKVSKSYPLVQVVGFKTVHGIMDEGSELRCLCGNPHIRKVFVNRNSLLECIVSSEYAKATGVWNSAQKPTNPARIRLTLPLEETIAEAESLLGYQKRILKNAEQRGGGCLVVSYEDIVYGDGIKKSLEWLGITWGNPRSQLKKQLLPEWYAKVVRNWDEISEEMIKIGYHTPGEATWT